VYVQRAHKEFEVGRFALLRGKTVLGHTSKLFLNLWSGSRSAHHYEGSKKQEKKENMTGFIDEFGSIKMTLSLSLHYKI
jgi:hypothetical protein